ncbi:MAG: MBOAT family O-acyltransferase [Acidobacteriota bacterium]
MVFSSPVFLFYFLPVTILSYFGISFISKNNGNIKNLVLLFFSMVFYFYGSGKFILIVLAVTLSCYIFGLFINNNKKNPIFFFISISLPLLLLIIFKYANFITLQIGSLAELAGLPPIPATSLILPIGISFYIFQALSYVIDVNSKKVEPEKNFFNLLLYISMFPQLIAGPIVRYSKIAKQIHNRRENLNDFSLGASRFVYGLSKKVIVADACGIVADTAYNTPLDAVTTPVALIGSLAYFLQIYFDFSAYSDMAIGLGRIFGFSIPENFNRPYSSSSISEFWRRWHITLSQWFRDYLFFPLGGPYKGLIRTYVNLWIVFILTGIWHGANWTFLIWGIYHGGFIFLEKLFGLDKHKKLHFKWRIITVFLVYMGWIIFRSDTMGQAFVFYSNIFIPTNWEITSSFLTTLTHKNVLLMILGLFSLFLPKDLVIGKYLEKGNNNTALFLRVAVMTIVLIYSIFIIASNNYSPFIYFQF